MLRSAAALFLFLILPATDLVARPDGLILIGEIAVYDGKEPADSDALPLQEIRSNLALALQEAGYRTREVERLRPGDDLPEEAFVFVSGYARRMPSGNLEIYGQIYHPGEGIVIDAVAVRDPLADLEGIEIDRAALQRADGESIDDFSRQIILRLDSNPQRRQRFANVNEHVAFDPISKRFDFPLRDRREPGGGSASEEEEIFRMIGERSREVSIVSKRVRSPSERGADRVTATATVVSRREIVQSGARNLTDILKAVPGIETFYDQFGFFKISLRGIRSRSGVLLLLDGHRINNFYDGSTFLDIRADAVERVEILRGPGSSIHGTNAFVGVINVITRRLVRDEGLSGDVSLRTGGIYSTFESQTFPDRSTTDRRISAYEPSVFFGNRSGDWTLSAYAAAYEAKRQTFHIEHDDTCNPDDWNDTEDVARRVNCATVLPLPLATTIRTNDRKQQRNFFFDARTDDRFYVSLKTIAEKRGPHVGELQELSPESESTQRLSLVDVGFDELRFASRVSARGKLYFDTLYREDDTQVERADDLDHVGASPRQNVAYDSSTFGTEFVSQIDIARTNALLIGLQIERLRVSNFTIEKNFAGTDTNRIFLISADYDNLPKNQNGERLVTGAFLEDNWDPFEWLSLTLGVRYDNYSDFGEELSPKSGAVLTPVDDSEYGRLAFRLLYGEAFRAPTFQELFDQTQRFQEGGVFGNPDLRPETVRTYEAGIEYRTPWKPLSISSSFFDTRIRDNIEGTNTSDTFPGTEDLYKNLNGINVRGLEAEVRLSLSPRYYAYVNYSWFRVQDLGGVFPENEEIPREVRTFRLIVPQWRANVGVQLGLGPYVDWHNAVHVSSERWSNYRFPFETQEERRFYFPVYALWNTSIATSDRVFENFRLQLSVFNVMDFRVYDDANTAANAFKNRSIPMEGRYIELKGSYFF